MKAAGKVLADNVDNLEGKAIACIAKSGSSLSDSLATLDVSITASVDIKGRFDSSAK